MTSSSAVSVAPAAPTRASVPAVLAALGAAAFVVGLFVAPADVWPAYLVAVFALTCAGLGGAVFLALHHVTGARWGRRILAVPQAMVAVLPWAGLAMLALAFGTSALYPWADAAAVAADEALAVRAGWMTVPLVLVRTVVAFAVWIALGRVLVARSRTAARTDDEASRAAAARASAWFLLAFAPTFSLYCFDWVLSLERHFASTMTAVYHFSGLLLSALALVTWLAIAERRRLEHPLDAAWTETLHDLGKLLFGFAFFWGYIWYCQYMLVWYTNLPEETPHYAGRHGGAWQPVALVDVLLQWAIPFVVLMPRAAKRNETVLIRVAGVVLVGRAVDLVLEIVQPVRGAQLPTGVWEAALLLGAAGVLLVAVRRALRAPSAPSSLP